MTISIVSDVIKISKDVPDIERELPKLCCGEIIRWAIIDVDKNFYTISYSYRK